MSSSDGTDVDAKTRRERVLEAVDEHMDKHREIYDKLARE